MSCANVYPDKKQKYIIEKEFDPIKSICYIKRNKNFFKTIFLINKFWSSFTEKIL